MAGDRDMRNCPVCKEPVDVTDWPVMEAEACQACGAALWVDYFDLLCTGPWSKVEF